MNEKGSVNWSKLGSVIRSKVGSKLGSVIAGQLGSKSGSKSWSKIGSKTGSKKGSKPKTEIKPQNCPHCIALTHTQHWTWPDIILLSYVPLTPVFILG